MSHKDLQTIENIKWDPPYDPASGWKKSSINVKNYGRMIHSSKVRFRFFHCQVRRSLSYMTLCWKIRDAAKKKQPQNNRKLKWLRSFCEVLNNDLADNDASFRSSEWTSSYRKRNPPKKSRWSNRKLLCGHQTPRNQPVGLTCWLAVNNTIISPQPVFGLALPCHSCETSVKENVRGERVPLMPSTDRR